MSIASIGSIPLAIYIYIKTKEVSFEKVKREVVRILLYQFGENRELTTFELQTVINSKLRENRLKDGAIVIVEIVEDLVAETISNPLIDNKKKELILENLRGLYYKSNLFEVVEKLNKDSSQQDIENKVKDIITQKDQMVKDMANLKEQKIRAQERYSNYFALISILATITVGIISIISEFKWKAILEPFNDLSTKDSFLINLLLGVFVSSVAGLFSTILRNIIIKNKKNK